MISPIPPAAASGRRERRSAELRDRLFQAALLLFSRKGYAETTVEDVTNAADVGKGTFFNYFPSKEHILAAFGNMQLAKVQAAADEAEKTRLPIRDFLHDLALQAVSQPAKSPAVVRAILQANLSSEPVRKAMRDIHSRATAMLARIIKVGQQRGEIRGELDPLIVAQTFRQSILGALLIWSLHGDGSIENRIENSLELLWFGMAAKPEVAKRKGKSL